MTLIPFAHLLGLPSKTAKRCSAKGVATKAATFGHLSKPPTAVPVTSKARRRAAEERRLRAYDDVDHIGGASVPCDYCGGTGTFGGASCPLCDGKGNVSVAEVRGAADRIVGAGAATRKPAPMSSATRGGSAAAKDAAAQIIAAGRKARGEA